VERLCLIQLCSSGGWAVEVVVVMMERDEMEVDQNHGFVVIQVCLQLWLCGILPDPKQTNYQ
jgi:hypothetical protein